MTIHPIVCPLQITLVKPPPWRLNLNRALRTMSQPKLAPKRPKRQPGAPGVDRRNRRRAGVDGAEEDGVAVAVVQAPTRAGRCRGVKETP